MKINHVAVTCRSVENSDRFYTGLMGFEKKRDRVVPSRMISAIFGVDRDVRVIDYVKGPVTIEVFIVDDAGGGRRFSHVCIEVEDRASFVEKCRTSGLNTVEVEKDGGGSIVFVDDHDNNRYEIKEQSKGKEA